ncbi:MAG: GTPase HflX [Candidatus Gracilibacteria bacterium]
MSPIPKAILVDVIPLDVPKYEAEERLKELENLVTTYGGVVIIKTIQKRGVPDYSTFVGKGKLEEIMQEGQEKGANLLIMNNILKPGQLFNLNEILRKKFMEAWDRIDLILKIFSKHAQTTEAKLQIELAKIRHMGPRIFGMGQELAQQRGGRGAVAGQGETNIELMKRHLQAQELSIQKKLKHYELIRAGHRLRRRRSNLLTAAIVGYTNAGKSSLLNALTGKKVYVADKLFATLDTRIGKIYLPQKHKEILISDTIGFIQDLPPDLIQAFKSTLAETVEADLILHVIDVADPLVEKKITVVEDILTQLGTTSGSKKIYVFNKMDLVRRLPPAIIDETKKTSDPRPGTELPRPSMLKAGHTAAELLGWAEKERLIKERRKNPAPIPPETLKIMYSKFHPIFVSAVTGQNLDGLKKAIERML